MVFYILFNLDDKWFDWATCHLHFHIAGQKNKDKCTNNCHGGESDKKVVSKQS